MCIRDSSELNRCFEEANRAFAYRYLKSRNQIIFSDHREKFSEDEELKVSSLNVEKLDRKIIDSFLKTGLKSQIRHFIDDYFQSLGAVSYTHLDVYKRQAGNPAQACKKRRIGGTAVCTGAIAGTDCFCEK